MIQMGDVFKASALRGVRSLFPPTVSAGFDYSFFGSIPYFIPLYLAFAYTAQPILCWFLHTYIRHVGLLPVIIFICIEDELYYDFLVTL